MVQANQFTHPIAFYGTYKTGSWAGYYFKERLGYTSGNHPGVDYNGPGAGDADKGMPLVAVANGIVRAFANRTDIGFGNTTIIQHYLSPTLRAQLGVESLFSRTMHQQNVNISVGQEVGIGQQIAQVGDTGTEWAHAHVELYKDTIADGGVHWRYDNNTELQSYLDTYEYIDSHLSPVDTAVPLFPYQRVVSNPTGVNHRSLPSTAGIILREWAKDEILDFQGYVEGEEVNGNRIWFVGRYNGGYLWSGSFQGGNDVHDLPNLTDQLFPKPNPTPDPIPADPLVKNVVNKKNPIAPVRYIPDDLIGIDSTQLRKEAMDAFKKLQAACPAPLVAGSGFRSYDTQSSLYTGYVLKDGQAKADTYSARPGFSEHQTGLAVDITGGGVGTDYELTFALTKQYKWLVDNAHTFGFVLRYPLEKTAITGYNFEPWHWRYVGVEDASSMYLSGKTLEEHYGVSGGLYPDQDGGNAALEVRVAALETSNTKVVNFMGKTFKEF